MKGGAFTNSPARTTSNSGATIFRVARDIGRPMREITIKASPKAFKIVLTPIIGISQKAVTSVPAILPSVESA